MQFESCINYGRKRTHNHTHTHAHTITSTRATARTIWAILNSLIILQDYRKYPRIHTHMLTQHTACLRLYSVGHPEMHDNNLFNFREKTRRYRHFTCPKQYGGICLS